MQAQFRKNEGQAELEFPLRSARWSSRSSATPTPTSRRSCCSPPTTRRERGADAAWYSDDLPRAIDDYLPSRDVKMLEYMELLAVFEASNRRMLPAEDTPTCRSTSSRHAWPF